MSHLEFITCFASFEVFLDLVCNFRLLLYQFFFATIDLIVHNLTQKFFKFVADIFKDFLTTGGRHRTFISARNKFEKLVRFYCTMRVLGGTCMYV